MAPRARADRVGGEGAARGDVRGLRMGVLDQAPAVAVLREHLQDAALLGGSEGAPPRLARVLSVRPGGRSDVWCCYVHETHAFEVAGGAISRNCDALRYLLVDLDGAAGTGGSLAAARDLRRTPLPSVAPGLLSSGSHDPIYSDPFGPRR